MSLTPDERELMLHALGLNRDRRSTRNYYNASDADEPLCEQLVGRGLMKPSAPIPWIPGKVYYVTPEGRMALAEAKTAEP